MIARIRGRLLEADYTTAVVDVQGVGYLVNIPMSTYDKLPSPGGEVDLFTVMAVREDDISLYGFATREEKQLYTILISVSGIGPKLGLSILSAMPVSAFCNAVNTADLTRLKQISGVGKRTAERLLVELKGKLDRLAPVAAAAAALPVDVNDATRRAVEDAILALEQLGFKRDRLEKTIHQLVTELEPKACSTENLIRKALQSLNSTVG